MTTVDVVLPKWGMTMQDGMINEWHVVAGDCVVEGQPMVTIETEKVDAEVEAPVTGTVLEVLVPVGETVAVGTVIARIDGG